MKSVRPIVSSAFSYDHNQCRSWFDRWLMRGGTVYRDTVMVERARDYQDLRTFDERAAWAKLEGDLRVRAHAMRKSADVIQFRHPHASRR